MRSLLLPALLWLAAPAVFAVESLPYCLLKTLPYDQTLFTQGLEVDGEELFVSSGGYGMSRIERRNSLSLDKLASRNLPQNIFAEGLTLWGDSLYLFSWKNRQAWKLDKATLSTQHSFQFSGEAWGLTHDSHHLILSNGSSDLHYLNPETLVVEKTLTVVLADGQPLTQLNELEYAGGYVWANVWRDPRIFKIDPNSGKVEGFFDLSRVAELLQRHPEAVLNGIAWDATLNAFWVTGKLWPLRFLLREGDCETPAREKHEPENQAPAAQASDTQPQGPTS